MLYSKSAEYAIQAMLYLADRRKDDLVLVSTIAEAYNIPRQFLAKLVQSLQRARLIRSFRGRKGGIRLARSPDGITLLQIVYAIEGPLPKQELCVIGLDYCSQRVVCPLHYEWIHIRDLIRDTFEHQTLADLVAGLRKKREELAAESETASAKQNPAG